jgi:hypothetical protein
MDYLINEQEDKARELLHQLFIEKARAIHEELMSEDDMEEEDPLQKDPGLGLRDEIEHHIDEVEMEQHYGTMEDVDLNDAVDDLSSDIIDDDEVTTDDDMDADEEDMDGEMDSEDDDEDEDMDADEEDMEDMDDEDEMDMDDHKDSDDQRISDLEQEIEDLKALYADIKSGGDHHEEEAHKEDDMEESWDSDDLEEFSDLEESLELDNVSVNAKKAAEVGSGKFARPESNTKSAVASNAPNMNGAKPVVTKGKVHSGYDRESAPTSGDMKHDSRVIKRTPVSKEGSTKALINKDRSEGFGAPNQKSPLGSGTTPKK